jgi:magnesium chelatase subunit I
MAPLGDPVPATIDRVPPRPAPAPAPQSVPLAPRRPPFPFTAIVGQAAMKEALLVAAVDPAVGGVMVFGHRGTGKSTAVRALAALLPPMKAVEGCRYGCDPAGSGGLCDDCRARRADGPLRAVKIPVPVVDLPLGATEDRVVGALDLERALTRGEKAFEPGLLARAHRGFLYIDEVNLLEDHIVDLLLDVAASGENVVEREGLSVRHPARFVLVGSGNPEEGELRPQLLDRFGLAVDVRTPDSIAERIEVVRRRDAFDRDPAAFVASWAKEEARLARRIAKARTAVATVAVPDAALERMARLCMALGTDGLRGELTLTRAARALAALEGSETVGDAEIRKVAPAVLGHRLRRDPLDDSGSAARVERAVAEVFGG